MQYYYLIIDDNPDFARELILHLNTIPGLLHSGTAVSKDEAINKILQTNPKLVFLNISGRAKSELNFSIITELHQYLNELPGFIVFSDSAKLAYDALKAGVSDYLFKPLDPEELRKAVYKFKKINLPPPTQAALPYFLTAPPAHEPEKDSEQQRSDVDIQVCIKSYGDYQFIALKDVVYLKADNNTTDFFMQNGKFVTAYKTLKHYENNLPSFFYRIHNSYIVNSFYVSRINTGKSLCYLSEIDISVPFTKTFKDNIDTIIRNIAPDYL